MLTKKTAILVDYENLRKGIFNKAYKEHSLFIDCWSPNKLVDFCKYSVFDTLDGNEISNQLYRIFFYTAKPLEDYKLKDKINAFWLGVEAQNYTAVRNGKLIYRSGVYMQKQVDMLLGIDMAELSIKHLIEKISLIGYDSDMSPALKMARMNGVQTEIICFTDICSHISHNLRKHCDIVKEAKYKSVLECVNRPAAKAIGISAYEA